MGYVASRAPRNSRPLSASAARREKFSNRAGQRSNAAAEGTVNSNASEQGGALSTKDAQL